ncbi:MAG TPA: hypothetical protein VIN10_01105 [Bacteroidales bacterium]
MGHELNIIVREKYVEIISKGEKSYETSLNLWNRAVEVCKENKCYKVLGIATSTKAPSTIDSYKHADLLHNFNIDYTFKIAWVELNPEEYGGIKFLENVLFNRGMNVKLFQDVETAKSWLLDEENADNV